MVPWEQANHTEPRRRHGVPSRGRLPSRYQPVVLEFHPHSGLWRGSHGSAFPALLWEPSSVGLLGLRERLVSVQPGSRSTQRRLGDDRAGGTSFQAVPCELTS